MVLSKFVIYNCVIYIIYKLLNKYKSNIKLKNSKPNKSEPIKLKSNLNLKDIYKNYDIKKKINYNDLDPNILKLINEKIEIVTITNNIILKENKENILLKIDDRQIKYSFISKKEYSYKIKFSLNSKDIDNIKLIISNNKKNFTYNYDEHNIMKDKIYKYDFTLDNNIFEDDIIDIYLLIISSSTILNINNIFIEIIEKSINEKKPLLIITINKKNIPLYSETSNIIYG
jgi:hypothetical protein